MRRSDVVVIVLLIAAAVVAAAAVGAGLLGWGKTDDAGVTAASTSFSPPPTGNNSTQANATAGANATSNATAAPTPAGPGDPADPSSCMAGMDMPGCTAAQADAYYAKMNANKTPPPPDKELPNVKIALTPQGDGETGAFTVDNGTQQLFVDVYLNDTGAGPYAALGPGGQGDLKLDLKGASGSQTLTMAGSANSVGASPAVPLSRSYHIVMASPGEGPWTITLEGQGTNTQVEVHLVERFYT